MYGVNLYGIKLWDTLQTNRVVDYELFFEKQRLKTTESISASMNAVKART